MESWLCSRPVLVHADCAVTRNFAVEASGGLYFEDYFQFEGCTDYLLKNKDTSAIMGENGKKYVKSNFDWDVITEKYIDFFKEVCGEF